MDNQKQYDSFTILLVDDNPNNLFTLETLLKRLDGCDIVLAESGEAALSATIEREIDLIFLDVQMPIMDGYDTAHHLKMTARTRDIPIVFLTAVFKSDEFVKRGYQLGAIDYLTKPIDDNLLLNRVALYRSLHQRETELGRALTALRQLSAENFRDLFEGSVDAILLIDPELGIVDCNQRAIELFSAIAKTQLLHKQLTEQSPLYQGSGFLSTELMQQYMQHALQHGMAQFEWQHQRLDGELLYVETLLSTIQWHEKRILHASLRDITVRKQMETAMHRQLFFSQAQNAITQFIVEQNDSDAILDNVLCIISETLGADRALIYDVSFKHNLVTGLYEWINPAYPEIISAKQIYPLSLFINGALQMFQSRKWLTSQAKQVHPRLLADGSATILHQQMHVKSLLWYPFAFREDGYYLLALNHLVNERTWVQDELEFLESVSRVVNVAIKEMQLLAEQRIAATAFESQEGMLITDAENRILRVNAAFMRITGYSSDELIGQTPNILASGRHPPEFFNEMWINLANQGMWEGEIWNRCKSGEIRPQYLTITAVRNGRGNITNYVACVSDITVRKRTEEEIRKLAFYDALTGLPNRRFLLERLQIALLNAERNQNSGALFFIDMDNFKTLNDTLGHDTGDKLLLAVTERLQKCVREVDTVSRLGGDEFIVMIEGLDTELAVAATQAETVGEKILASLNTPYELSGHIYHSTPSIGVTLFGQQRISLEELLKQADIAMYQAKRTGRNAMRFFDQVMQELVNDRAFLEEEIRKAIQDGSYQLYYQIQQDDQGKPIGAEALLHWHHPVRGNISPAHFIPLAEDSGLILPIGDWVMAQSCAQIRTWQENPLTCHLTLSVNVSAKQYRQPDFAEQVMNLVDQYGINPALLKLELTEGMMLENIEVTIATMQHLKQQGIKFSLDDFGTGYSSLQYLKRLPLDQIKIDQSFVRDILTDPNDRAIVQTIIAMAKSLGLEVIAEGVETEAQRQLLLEMGCMQFQGFLLSRPISIDQFETLLHQIDNFLRSPH